MDRAKLQAGRLLIAEPFLGDPNFERSVVLIARYSADEGAFGLVLNQSCDFSLNTALKKDWSQQVPLSIGGPVERDHVFWLHCRPDIIPDGMLVYQNLYLGGNAESMFAALDAGLLQTYDIRFFLGYSGWSAGQLEGEMKRNSWILTQADHKLLLQNQEASFWRETLKKMGGDYKVLANYPTDPRLN